MCAEHIARADIVVCHVAHSIVFAMAFPGISPHDNAQKKPGQMEGTTTAAGKKFLSDHAQQIGVVVLPSGVQYIVQHQGEGFTLVEDGIDYPCKYSGRVFDSEQTYFSSFKQPMDIKISTTSDHVVKGVQEVMRLMSVGDRFEIFVPSELAYGDSAPGEGRIPSGSVIIVVLELTAPEKDEL